MMVMGPPPLSLSLQTASNNFFVCMALRSQISTRWVVVVVVAVSGYIFYEDLADYVAIL